MQGTSGVLVLASDRASGEGRSLVPLDEELAGAVPLHMLPAVDIRSVSLSYSNSGYRLLPNQATLSNSRNQIKEYLSYGEKKQF